jgi:hypothetical protein
MQKTIEIGACFFSWGAELQQDDQAFYGVAIHFGPFRWAFLGIGIDSHEQPHRDERQRLLRIFGDLETLLWARSSEGSIATAAVREVLERTNGPRRWDQVDVG